jgi:hypothetical protein
VDPKGSGQAPVARSVTAAQTPYGGYLGYFSDVDGYLWKVAATGQQQKTYARRRRGSLRRLWLRKAAARPSADWEELHAGSR